MSNEQQQAEVPCGDCGGLGAKVVTEPYTDAEGYTMQRQRDVTCGTCLGKGKVPA